MALTPEAKVKLRVRQILDEFATVDPVYYFFPPANGYGRQGIPDVIVCINGKFLGIECKAGKGKTTTLQEREMAKIRAANGATMVVNEDNLNKLVAYLILFKNNHEHNHHRL